MITLKLKWKLGRITVFAQAMRDAGLLSENQYVTQRTNLLSGFSSENGKRMFCFDFTNFELDRSAHG